MYRDLDGAVLVTGGSGFIGSAVLKELASVGVPIRLLVPESDKDAININCKEIIIGDVRDRDSVRKAMNGVKYLFHIAGNYRLWARNSDEIFSVNVLGTKNVMEEAVSAKVACVIHTSSASTIKQGAINPADETALASETDADGPYTKSKIVADDIVRNLIRTQSLQAIIVKPTTVIGPGDIRPTPTGQLVLNAVRGKMPAYVDTRLNISHVEDIAKGFLLAFKNGAIGHEYILGGDNVTLEQFLFEVSKNIGAPAPKWKLPATPLLPFAYANEFYANLTGVTPFLTVAGLKHARSGLVYNTDRANKELGYVSRPFAETVKSAVSFYLENNHAGV